jgi:hypothetical protein
LTPRASVEDSGQRCQYDIPPVEVHRAFVEVREPEKNSSRQQRPPLPKAPFQQVLHPAAKEKLLGNCDKEKSEDPP